MQAKNPIDWLNAFGAAINTSVNRDRAAPLPLAAPPQHCWRLALTLHSVQGLPTGGWERPYLKAKLKSSAVRLPKCRCASCQCYPPCAISAWCLPAPQH